MMTETETVAEWHIALNAGDVERLVVLSDAEIEVGGPRGADRGVALLRNWVDRAAIQLEPTRVFQQGAVVVVEQRASWRAPESAELSDPQIVASAFSVERGRVTRVIRYPDLTTALRETGLERSSEHPVPTS